MVTLTMVTLLCFPKKTNGKPETIAVTGKVQLRYFKLGNEINVNLMSSD